jgi:hypothetical protein
MPAGYFTGRKKQGMFAMPHYAEVRYNLAAAVALRFCFAVLPAGYFTGRKKESMFAVPDCGCAACKSLLMLLPWLTL